MPGRSGGSPRRSPSEPCEPLVAAHGSCKPHRTKPHRTKPHRVKPHRTKPHRTKPHRGKPHRAIQESCAGRAGAQEWKHFRPAPPAGMKHSRKSVRSGPPTIGVKR
ncbi:hypothetical protein GCM10022420_095030 [Streptomyces iranensis]